jgi:hypothetical protein
MEYQQMFIYSCIIGDELDAMVHIVFEDAFASIPRLLGQTRAYRHVMNNVSVLPDRL